MPKDATRTATDRWCKEIRALLGTADFGRAAGRQLKDRVADVATALAALQAGLATGRYATDGRAARAYAARFDALKQALDAAARGADTAEAERQSLRMSGLKRELQLEMATSPRERDKAAAKLAERAASTAPINAYMAARETAAARMAELRRQAKSTTLDIELDELETGVVAPSRRSADQGDYAAATALLKTVPARCAEALRNTVRQPAGGAPAPELSPADAEVRCRALLARRTAELEATPRGRHTQAVAEWKAARKCLGSAREAVDTGGMALAMNRLERMRGHLDQVPRLDRAGATYKRETAKLQLWLEHWRGLPAQNVALLGADIARVGQRVDEARALEADGDVFAAAAVVSGLGEFCNLVIAQENTSNAYLEKRVVFDRQLQAVEAHRGREALDAFRLRLRSDRDFVDAAVLERQFALAVSTLDSAIADAPPRLAMADRQVDYARRRASARASLDDLGGRDGADRVACERQACESQLAFADRQCGDASAAVDPAMQDAADAALALARQQADAALALWRQLREPACAAAGPAGAAAVRRPVYEREREAVEKAVAVTLPALDRPPPGRLGQDIAAIARQLAEAVALAAAPGTDLGPACQRLAEARTGIARAEETRRLFVALDPLLRSIRMLRQALDEPSRQPTLDRERDRLQGLDDTIVRQLQAHDFGAAQATAAQARVLLPSQTALLAVHDRVMLERESYYHLADRLMTGQPELAVQEAEYRRLRRGIDEAIYTQRAFGAAQGLLNALNDLVYRVGAQAPAVATYEGRRATEAARLAALPPGADLDAVRAQATQALQAAHTLSGLRDWTRAGQSLDTAGSLLDAADRAVGARTAWQPAGDRAAHALERLASHRHADALRPLHALLDDEYRQAVEQAAQGDYAAAAQRAEAIASHCAEGRRAVRKLPAEGDLPALQGRLSASLAAAQAQRDDAGAAERRARYAAQRRHFEPPGAASVLATLERHPQRWVAAGELATMQSRLAEATAAADGAVPDLGRALAALDSATQAEAAARLALQMLTADTPPAVEEIAAVMAQPGGVQKIDTLVAQLDPRQRRGMLHRAVEARFGCRVDFFKDDVLDTSDPALGPDLMRFYDCLATLPPQHGLLNDHLLVIEDMRDITGTTGAGGGSYADWHRKITINEGSAARSDGNELAVPQDLDDAVVEACRPATTGVVPSFDWSTLHEVGHSLDHRHGFMAARHGQSAFGGWTEYGGDLLRVADKLIAEFHYDRVYCAELLAGGVAPAAPPAPDGVAQAEWNQRRLRLAQWVVDARTGRSPWQTGALSASLTLRTGEIIHEAYAGQWVGYPAAERTKGISGYQFRSPGEWFAELYAAHRCGKLKPEHPAAGWLLRLDAGDAA